MSFSINQDRSQSPRSRIGRVRPVVALVLGLFVLLSPTWILAGGPPFPWEKLRPDHPRLFVNKDMMPALINHIQGGAKEYFDSTVGWVDYKFVGQTPDFGDNGERAAIAAMIYLFTRSPGHLLAAKRLLEQSLLYYRQCDRENKAVSWWSNTRINAFSAYDWLYNDLTPEERKKFGLAILDHVSDAQYNPAKPKVPGRNYDRPGDGFYGVASMLWYAGLATYGAGADDARAKKFIGLGWDLYHQVLEFRSKMSDDDGGLICSALGYSLVMYPWSEFLFFHTVKSSLGLDLAPQWPYVPWQVNNIIWNILPGNRWFGSGDAYHVDNKLPGWWAYTHMAQIRYFYGQSHPDLAALAHWIQQNRLDKQELSESFPFVPILLTGLDSSPPPKSPGEFDFPPARHFQKIRQVFMHTGWGPDDTYALFTTEAVINEHDHWDENNFVIFHKGFLALDSGSRPEPGSHLFNYYCRTIAHNCILIHMPGEEMPEYWGDYAPGEPPLPTPNDGGQQEVIGGKTAAFETQPEYTYVAGDATKCYHPRKPALVLRQFLFVPPRHFVVFDRVVSQKADQKKTWLLHTAREPRITGQTFQTEHENGRLFCSTLLPQKAELKAIGGPGRQFWSGGRNWPIPADSGIDNNLELLGQWRVEVTPARDQAEEYFLHLIEVGDKDRLTAMGPFRLIDEAKEAGVEFEGDDGLKVRVTFARQGPPAGKILYEKGNQRFEKALTRQVQKQAGLTGTSMQN